MSRCPTMTSMTVHNSSSRTTKTWRGAHQPQPTLPRSRGHGTSSDCAATSGARWGRAQRLRMRRAFHSELRSSELLSVVRTVQCPQKTWRTPETWRQKASLA
jgi:hypothetical protein